MDPSFDLRPYPFFGTIAFNIECVALPAFGLLAVISYRKNRESRKVLTKRMRWAMAFLISFASVAIFYYLDLLLSNQHIFFAYSQIITLFLTLALTPIWLAQEIISWRSCTQQLRIPDHDD